MALLLWSARAALCAENIPLYVYYNDPPFAVGAAGSLTDKLATWLSERSNGRYHFTPTQLPRRRLELMISQPRWPGVVAWANPRWFDDARHPRQSWSRPYMLDANMVVSRRDQPLEYLGDKSLTGQRVGSVQGFSYADIDGLIKSGKLVRDDADSELRNLAKLKSRRVQVAFLQASSFPYFRREYADLDDWVYLSARPRTLFDRAFFLAPGQPALLAYMNRQADALNADRQWRALLGTCQLIVPRLAGSAEPQSKLCR